MSADDLIAHAERCKVKIKDGRLEFPRDFPAYAGGNKYVSNVPGSTMFMPVTEVTRQYINGLFYVLAQEPGRRPLFLDDFNNWLPCGCERWVKSKFLNKQIPIPLTFYGKGRTDYEAMLLLQNLALVAQSMGLGGWIHAAFENTILLGGYPDIGPGLGFRFERPKKRLIPRPYPASAPNPVGLDGVLQSYAPPYYKDTDAAIDAILAEKYGPSGLYSKAGTAAPSMKPEFEAAFIRESPHVEPGDRRSRACHLPLHLENLQAVSGTLPRHRFSRHLDAVSPHRPRVLRLASSGRPTRQPRPRMPTRGTAECASRSQGSGWSSNAALSVERTQSRRDNATTGRVTLRVLSRIAAGGVALRRWQRGVGADTSRVSGRSGLWSRDSHSATPAVAMRALQRQAADAAPCFVKMCSRAPVFSSMVRISPVTPVIAGRVLSSPRRVVVFPVGGAVTGGCRPTCAEQVGASCIDSGPLIRLVPLAQ